MSSGEAPLEVSLWVWRKKWKKLHALALSFHECTEDFLRSSVYVNHLKLPSFSQVVLTGQSLQ